MAPPPTKAIGVTTCAMIVRRRARDGKRRDHFLTLDEHASRGRPPAGMDPVSRAKGFAFDELAADRS